MSYRERQFWITVRQALLLLVSAIETRYRLESAVITREQRREMGRSRSRRDGNEDEIETDIEIDAGY